MIRIFVSAFAVALFAQSAFAQSNTPLSGDARVSILEEIATTVDENYFDEARAREIADALRAADFSGFDTHETFSDAVTEILFEYDRHFSVQYLGPDQVAEMFAEHEDTGEPDGDPLAAAQMRNFGFEDVSVLPGNIGYIRFNEFAPAQFAGDTASAALDFVGFTDAVIFDVRENGGGEPSMVQFLISHFLNPNESVAINTFVSRQNEHPVQLNSLNYLPSEARPDVPVFVLTSGATGSAAEAFAYHLQAMERATIVGETTYGAGNPGSSFFLDSGYRIFVSTGSARNPITGTNWEAVGVAPDVEVSREGALDMALLAAFEQLIEAGGSEMQIEQWTWGREYIAARITPHSLSAGEMEEFAGAYGPRRVFVDGAALMYQRGDRDAIQLVPLGGDRFLYGQSNAYRVVFERNGRGRVTALAIHSLNGPPSVSPRD